MKYALIIIDGAADETLSALGGKTPLAAADLKAMDRLARSGILGLVRTCPSSLPCGSDVAIMSVLGYDPVVHYTGRAPLEAAARSIPLSDTDWVLRVNTVTIEDGIMKDNTADNIAQSDAEKIIALLNDEFGGAEIEFHSGVGYRNLLVVHRDIEVATTPPHDILERTAADFLPKGASAPFLIDLYEKCRALLSKKSFAPAANAVWFWGEGKKPRLAPFHERFGLSGSAITAVDLVRGLARLAGWDIISVPGATGYFDTDYQAKGEYAVRALEKCDLVCVHIEAPDEAGHKGDAWEKMRALENIDRCIVDPVHRALERNDAGWRMLLLPDHPTPCLRRTHTHDPVPFVIAGSDIGEIAYHSFTEADARKTGVFIEEGHTLMHRFIGGFTPPPQ